MTFSRNLLIPVHVALFFLTPFSGQGKVTWQTRWTQQPILFQEPTTVAQTRRPRPKPTRRTTTTPQYEDYEDYNNKEPEFHVDGTNCGVPTGRGNFLILGGEEAEKGDWPWQAAMFKTSSTGLSFQCGGSLVSNRHIITAAHCVYLRQQKKVVATDTMLIYLGKHSLRSWTEDGQQAKEVNRIIVHPKYSDKNLNYDVSILILSTSVVFSEYVIPVCLWDRSPSLNEIIDNPGTVIGWGRDDEGQTANELKVAKMPVVSQENCLRSNDFYNKFTSNVTFCAGYRNGTSVCNGDSGGGMFFHLDNPKQEVKTWYTRGVVSIGMLEASEQRCDSKSYVVFTDLAKILPWLHRQLAPLPS